MASDRNVIPGLGTWICKEKQAFNQVKQQFVTKTLIPRNLTKHITNDSMKKKFLHSNLKVQLSSTMYP